MKKKLFLLITCFFLCAAVATFFYLRKNKIASPEITKKFEEEKKKLEEEKKKLEAEVERLLTELKEKNNSNQEEKVNENKNKEQKEETDDLPWHLNWIG